MVAVVVYTTYFYKQLERPEPIPLTFDEEIDAHYIYLITGEGVEFLGHVPDKEQTFGVMNTMRSFTSPLFDDKNNLYYIATVHPNEGSNPQTGGLNTENWTNRLIQISPDGARTDVATFGTAGSTGSLPNPFLSQDRTRLAYCLNEGKLEVLQLSTLEKRQFNSKGCDIAGSMHFSRDDKEILSYVGFYEGPYEFTGTAEDYRQLQLDSGVGHYRLSLETREETYLGPDRVVLKDVMQNRELRRDGKEVVIKNVSSVSGDLLTKEEYRALPTVATISVEDADVWGGHLTADGKGVWYMTHKRNLEDPVFILGYYDIAENKNYYPLSTHKYQPVLLPPIDKNGLYYFADETISTNEWGSVIRKHRIIHMSLDGSSEVVAEKIGESTRQFVIYIAP